MSTTTTLCSCWILLITTCKGGLPSRDEEGEGSQAEPAHAAGPQSLDALSRLMVHQANSRRRYKCHSCVPPYCDADASDGQGLCRNALYCWKASVRVGGQLRHSRGCALKNNRCFMKVYAPKRHTAAAGQLNITCCQGDLCNGGDFPDLYDAVTVTEDNDVQTMSSLGESIILAYTRAATQRTTFSSLQVTKPKI